jgi:hypothetical protein
MDAVILHVRQSVKKILSFFIDKYAITSYICYQRLSMEVNMQRSTNYLEVQALLNQTINAVHSLVTSDATEAEVGLLLGAAGGLQEAQSMLIKARLRLENDGS